MDTSHFGGRGGVIWGSAVTTMFNKKFLKSWGNLPIALNPSNFYFIFLVSTTQPSQNPKKEKENLYPAPNPPEKRKKRDLFPLTTLHKSKKWTCTQPLTLPKNKNKNRLNTTSTPSPPLSPNKKIKISFCSNYFMQNLSFLLNYFSYYAFAPLFQILSPLKAIL